MSDQPAEETALRAELTEARAGLLDGVAAHPYGCHELVGAAVAGLALPTALLLTGVALTPPDRTDTSSTVSLAVLALLLWALGALALRPYLHRRRREIRSFWLLRRRERALVAQLPSGTTGPPLWWQYTGRFFGHPALLVLWGVAIAGVLLVALVA